MESCFSIWLVGLISGLIGLWIECIRMLNYTGLENKDVLVVGLAKVVMKLLSY